MQTRYMSARLCCKRKHLRLLKDSLCEREDMHSLLVRHDVEMVLSDGLAAGKSNPGHGGTCDGRNATMSPMSSELMTRYLLTSCAFSFIVHTAVPVTTNQWSAIGLERVRGAA
mgnify:CR=1 FL=1